MSQSSPNTSLSLSTRLLCYLGPPSAILLTYSASSQAALITSLAFIPSGICYHYWKKENKLDSSRRGELEPLVWTYVSAGTVGVAAVGTIQLAIYGLFYAVEALIYGYPTVSKNWIFNIVTSFIAIGLVEGAMKTLPVIYARRKGSSQSQKPSNRAYVDYVLAGVLGLDLAQSIEWISRICVDGQKTSPEILLLLFTRLAMGSSSSLLFGTSTALRAVRKDHLGEDMSSWSVIAPSVISMGIFNFVILSSGTLAGKVGWQYPTDSKMQAGLIGTLAGVVGLTTWQVMRDWKLVNEHDAEEI